MRNRVVRELAEDRKGGSLELLLSTPLTVREMLRGQRLALQRQFLGPVMAVLFIAIILMIATARETAIDQEHIFFTDVWCARMFMLIADLVGLYWVGMWQALMSKNPGRAASASVARILVFPWIAFALIALLISLGAFRTESDLGEKFFLGLWVFLGLAADIGLGLRARHKLLSEFRRTVSERYTARPGFWKRWLAGNESATSVQLQPVKEV